MAKVNAQEYAEKWNRRIKGSTEDIRRGIRNTTEAPGVKAAKQVQLMKANLMKALEDGSWERAVSRVTLQEWQEAMEEKGIPRLAAGVDAAMNKQVVMAEQLLADVDSVVAEVDKTPRGDLETNINRMTTFARGMARKAQQRKGRR